MFYVSLIFYIFLFIWLSSCNCPYESNYILYGKQIQLKNEHNICQNATKCSYLQVNIPELMVGYVQDCETTNINLFANLTITRNDIFNTLPSNVILKMIGSCKNNVPYFVNGSSFSGDFYTYFSCSNDWNTISKQNVPPIPLLPNPSNSIMCRINSTSFKSCFEGYCSYFQYAINSTLSHQSEFRIFKGCPTDLFNYLFEVEFGYGHPFNNILVSIGESCINKNRKNLSKFLLEYQYDFYYDCNSNESLIESRIPQLPPPSIMSPVYGKCNYEVSGYFVNSDLSIQNNIVYCAAPYCISISTTVNSNNGTFKGCGVDLEVYLRNIYLDADNNIPEKIESIVNNCSIGINFSENINSQSQIQIDCMTFNEKTTTPSPKKGKASSTEKFKDIYYICAFILISIIYY
uniref:Transmembrane domain-containing protein n=1 Tax=Parastrongyloides trichosuri TaxID=131310 RepID=A0A0N4ZUX0_PARTI